MTEFRNTLKNPAWICFVWVGLTIGVSMIATPTRFTAETITRPIALDVGRVVFAALNKAELITLILLLIVVRVSGNAARLWSYCAALAFIVITQSTWLTPELAERTQVIIDGGVPPKSYLHTIYASFELIKIALLLLLGFSSLGGVPSSGSAEPD